MEPKFPTDSNLPLCTEVCTDCRDGRHIFHILNELGDIWAEKEHLEIDGRPLDRIRISGYAEDELWLNDLLRIIALEVGRRKQ